MEINFSDQNILVVGDLMLDEYIVGQHYRISDEAPVPILKVDAFEVRLGGAANVAHNMKNLGCNVLLCGIIGRRRGGLGYGHSAHRFVQLMEECGMSMDLVIEADWLTTTKTRVLINSQQVVRYDYEKILDRKTQKIAEDRLASLDYKDIDLIVVSDYRKGMISDSVMDLLRSKNKRIVVDPKPDNLIFYQDVFCITPNMSEFEKMTGETDLMQDRDKLVECARNFITQYSLHCLIITMGMQGVFFCCETQEAFIQGKQEEIANIIGAGDTFVATFSAAISANVPVADAISMANRAAGIVVSKQYTSIISIEELRTELNDE